MIWRHIMLAVPSADMVPVPVLDRAGRIARGLQSELEVFLCLYEPDIVQPLEDSKQIEERIAARVDEQHRRLERLADQLRDQGLKVRTSAHWDYPVYEGVIRQVLRHRPEMLIVPAMRTSDVTQRALAYREARLIETCPCPLLLLKTPEVYPAGSVVAAVDPLHTEEGWQALVETTIGAAKTVAHALADAPVRIYQAVLPPPEPARVRAPCASPSSSHLATRIAGVRHQMSAIAQHHDIRDEDVRIEFNDVETGLPAFAREERAQIVVMGASPRRFPDAASFAHAAEKVSHALECDVLVVKPDGYRGAVSAEHAPAVPRPTW